MDEGDFVLVIEDADGTEVVRIVQSMQHGRPVQGEWIPLDATDVKDQPELVGRYLIHRVELLRPVGATSTRRRLRVAHCFTRRLQVDAATTAEPSASSLEAFAGKLDEATAAEVARRTRELATDLDDLADEVALAVNSGARLDHRVVDRLNDASRRAKQVALGTMLRAKQPDATA